MPRPSRPASTSSWKSRAASTPPASARVMETNKLADEKGLKVAVGLQRRHSKEYRRQDQGDPRRIAGRRDAAAGLLERRPDLDSQPPARPDRNGIPDAQLVSLRLALRRSHLSSSTSTTSTSATGSRTTIPCRPTAWAAATCRNNRGIGQIYDNHFVEFTYKDGTKLYSQCRQQPNTWEQRYASSSTAPRASKELPGNGSDGYKQEHVDLVNAIRKNEKLNDGWHGATSSFTAVLGRMATYSGPGGQLGRRGGQGPQRNAGRSSPSTPIRRPCPTRTATTRWPFPASTSRTDGQSVFSSPGVYACGMRDHHRNSIFL